MTWGVVAPELVNFIRANPRTVKAKHKGTTMRTLGIPIMLLGAVALGFGQNVRPQLIVVSTTNTSVTLQLQAGSDPLPYGFEVSYQSNRGEFKHTLEISADQCSQFALQPGQISPPFTVDGISDGDCLTYNQRRALACATPYRFFAKAGQIVSTGVTTLTSPCD
jgi:hypothetical protein